MFLFQYLRSRLKRGISIFAIGPNEARLLYDFLVSFGGLISSIGFKVIFLGEGIEWWSFLTPLALVSFNGLFGIYSKLRMAAGRVKAIVLAASMVCVCGVFWVLTGDAALMVLWAMITAPALILPRLFLSLPYSKHKNLAVATIKQRGPVLVIGGAGYIGSHVVDLLLQDGQGVRVLDRLIYGREALADFEGHRSFEFIQGDATDISKLTMAMKGASAVIHLAGLVGDPACALDPPFTRHANIICTRMVKEMAQSMGIYRFVFASSCSVYGVSDKEVREGYDLSPVSLYGQTKIDSEKELLFSVPDDFFITILRFATVFGHSWRPRFDLVANLFTAQAMADGIITVIGPQQWRPFVHVRDLARAVLMVLKTNPVSVQSQIFNVGDRRLNMTILQLAEVVKSCVEKNGRQVKIAVQDDIQDKRNYAVSFDKIRTMLGFEAATLMEAGIQEMVENFNRGKYKDYRDQIYSNVAMTKIASAEFHDPMQSMKLYAPIENRFINPP